MIQNFVHKGLGELFSDGKSAKVAPAHQARILRMLDALEDATKLEDLNIPGFRCHPLKGDRAGYYAMSVNGPWRITFKFEDGHASDVDLEQYH